MDVLIRLCYSWKFYTNQNQTLCARFPDESSKILYGTESFELILREQISFLNWYPKILLLT